MTASTAFLFDPCCHLLSLDYRRETKKSICKNFRYLQIDAIYLQLMQNSIWNKLLPYNGKSEDMEIFIYMEFDSNVYITTIIVYGPFIVFRLSIPLMVLSISLVTLRHTHYIHYNLLIYNRKRTPNTVS